MKKTVKLWLALALMIVMGSTQAWAIAGSYTIQFKDAGNWVDGSATVSDIEDIISSGAMYVSEIPSAQVSRVYNAQSNNGIRLGAAAGGGMLKLVLTEAVKPTKITFQAKWYADDEKTITVNGKKFTLNETWQNALYEDEDNPELITGYADYEIEYDGKTEVSEIAISSDKRAYIKQITVDYAYEIEDMFIVGDFAGWGDEAPKLVKMTYNKDTEAFEYEFEHISNGGMSYNFAFSDKGSFEDWDAFNQMNHRYAISTYNYNVYVGTTYQLSIRNSGNASLRLYANQGKYKLSIAKKDLKLSITYTAAENAVNYQNINIDDKYISAYDNDIAKAVEAKTAQIEAQGYKVGNVTINLNAEKEYTVSSTIKVAGNFWLNGNNSTINVAEAMTDNIVTLDGTRSLARKADGTYSDHKLISDVYFGYVTILGIKGALVRDNQKTLVENLNIEKSVIEMPAAGKNVLDFNGKGYAAYVNVYQSTIYAKGKNTGFFAQYGSRPKNVNSDLLQEFNVQYSTFVNIANGKNFCDLKQNGTAQNVYTLRNSIFVDCGKNGQVVVGFNKGQTSATPEWDVDNNCFNWGGEDTNEAEVSKAGKKDDDDIVQNCIDGVVEFADAANGDFTLGECDAKGALIGDHRWIGDKIENDTYYSIGQGKVKNAFNSNIAGVSWNTPLVEYNYNTNLTKSYQWNAPKGAKVTASLYSGNSNYAINGVTAVPVDVSWNSANAPKRAPGFMQAIEATKGESDNEWVFTMPDYAVNLNVSLGYRIRNTWITVPDEVAIPKDFEGKVEPEIVVTDKVHPIQDEDGEYVLDEEGNYTYPVLKEGEDYTIEFEDNTDMGVATVIVTGKGKYAGTVNAYFNIVKVLVAETEEEVGEDGLVNAVIVQDDEDAKTCVITGIEVKEGETTLTIPEQVEGYDVIGIANNAAQDLDNITDIYLPAIGENGEEAMFVAENALLPMGFTHPKDMVTVHVPLQVLDDYANEAGLKKFAKYSHLVAEVTIPESGYATFSTGIPVQFDEDVVVNYVVNYSAEAVKKQAAKNNMVAAFTGVLLYGEPGEHTVYAINDNTQIEDVEENLLEAVTFATNFDADDADFSYFILKDGKFYAIADNNNEVPSCKAILKIAKTEAAAAALVLDIFEGNTTGIRSIDAASLKDGQLYDLNGRKVSKAQKGVFILNGKKVVVK